METILMIFIIAILVMISYLIYLNIKSLKKVVIYKKDEEVKISDQRYFELNNKIQLLIVVSSIILLIGGFVGYNSINSIKSEIKIDIQRYKSHLENYDTLVASYNFVYDTTVLYYNNLMDYYETQRKELSQNFKEVTENANKTILKLIDDYKLTIKTYLVSNIEIKNIEYADQIDEEDEIVKLYFNKLTTTNGKRLPEFKEPPYLYITVKGTGDINIEKITKDYFEYGIMRYGSVDPKTKKVKFDKLYGFDLLIIEKE